LASSKRRPDHGGLERAEEGDYSRLTKTRTSRADLCREIDAYPGAEIVDADFNQLKSTSEPEIVDLHLPDRLASLTNRFTDPFRLNWKCQRENLNRARLL
jgi:hypothetical protein